MGRPSTMVTQKIVALDKKRDEIDEQIRAMLQLFISRCNDVDLPLQRSKVIYGDSYVDTDTVHIAFDWGEGDRQWLSVPAYLVEGDKDVIDSFFEQRRIDAEAAKKQKQDADAAAKAKWEWDRYQELKKKFE